MQCKYEKCTNHIDTSHIKANNKKYCSLECRDKHYYDKYKEKRKAKSRERLITQYGLPGPGKLQCELCGNWYQSLGHHVAQAHKVSAYEYRAEQSYSNSERLTSDKVYKKFSTANKKNHSIVVNKNLIEKGIQTRFKKGEKQGPKRKPDRKHPSINK